jgi:teichuronic acid exporter
MLTAVRQILRQIEQGSFLSNLGWLASGEMVVRLSRIGTAIVLARNLTPLEFGLAALAITTFEIVRLFSQNGIGSALVRSPQETFPGLCRTAHISGWVICLSLFIVQSAIGVGFGYFTGNDDIMWMIICLACVYPLMPAGLIHAAVLRREQRLKRIAIVSTSQVVVDNVLTAALALAGFGPWAIVLPKFLTTPIWLIGVMWKRPWRPQRDIPFAPIKPLLGFTIPVLGTELLVALRMHADKFIIGAVFGVEALGVYYFAFNAGLGLSGSLANAFIMALYPHLCEARRLSHDLRAVFDRAMKTGGLFLIAVFVVQAFASLYYVPIVFGAQWAFAAPLVAILCLAAPATLICQACGTAFRSEGCVRLEMAVTATITVATMSALTIGAQFSLPVAAGSLTIGLSLCALILLPTCREHLAKASFFNVKSAPMETPS